MAAEVNMGVQINKFIKQLSAVINSFKMYPAGHSIIVNAMEKLNTIITELIQDQPDITIGLTEDSRVLVSGESLQMTPFLAEFAKSLTDRDIKSLTFKQNVSTDELAKFVNFFNLNPQEIKSQGGFSGILEGAGLKQITADQMIYREGAIDGAIMQEIEEASDLKLREMAKSFDLPYKGRAEDVKRRLKDYLKLKDKEALSTLPTAAEVEAADIETLKGYCQELGISHKGKLSVVRLRLIQKIEEEAVERESSGEEEPEAEEELIEEDVIKIKQDDLEMFQSLISKQAKMEIDQVKLYNVAVKDEMTGLYNHRYLQQRMDQEIKNSDLFNAPVSFILSDVDHFKNFNDTYGHQEGDRVLKIVAKIMQDEVGTDGIPCRYGGEEFSVICPGKPPDETAWIAEKIRAALEAEQFMINGERVLITISLGVCTFPEFATGKMDLIKKSDQALYFAKENGRNRVANYAELKSEEVNTAAKLQQEEEQQKLAEQIAQINEMKEETGEQKTLDEYVQDLAAEDIEIKKKAILGISRYDSDQVRALLETLSTDVDEEIRYFSTHVLRALKGEIPLGEMAPPEALAVAETPAPAEAPEAAPAEEIPAEPEAAAVEEPAPAPPAEEVPAEPPAAAEETPAEEAPAGAATYQPPQGTPPKAVDEFLQDLAYGQQADKLEALRWLPTFDDERVPGMVEMAQFDPDETVQGAAAFASKVLKGEIVAGAPAPAAVVAEEPALVEPVAAEPAPVAEAAPEPPAIEMADTGQYQGLSLDELTAKMDGTSPAERAAIVTVIGNLDNPRIAEVLEMAMFDGDINVQRAAATGLRRLGKDVELPEAPEAAPAVEAATTPAAAPADADARSVHIQNLESGTPEEKIAALDFFVSTGDAEKDTLLEMSTFDEDRSVREHAKKLLPSGDAAGAEVVEEDLSLEQCSRYLDSGDEQMRRLASYGLSQLPDTRAGKLPMEILFLLEQAVLDSDRLVRRFAETAIYRLARQQTITESLEELTTKFNSEVTGLKEKETPAQEAAAEAEEARSGVPDIVAEVAEEAAVKPADKPAVRKKKVKRLKPPRTMKSLDDFQQDLADGNPLKKKDAISGISQFDDPRVKDFLELALFDESEAVQQLAQEAIDGYTARAESFSSIPLVACSGCGGEVMESNYWCPECATQLQDPAELEKEEEEEEIFEEEEDVPPEELPLLEEQCSLHTDEQANYLCTDCQEPFCIQCGRLIAGSFHCSTCLEKRKPKRKISLGKLFSRNIKLAVSALVLLAVGLAVIYYVRINSTEYIFEKGRSFFENGLYREAIVELQRAEQKSQGKHTGVNKLLIRSFYELSKTAPNVDLKLNQLLEAQKRGGAATDQDVRNDLREVYIKKAQQTTDPNTKGDLLESARQLASGDQIDEILKMMKQVADQTKRYRRVLELITEYYNQKQSKNLRDLLIQAHFDAAKEADSVQDKIRLLKKVQAIDEENEEVLTWLALAQVELAEATKASDVAIGMLERALTYDPECEEAKTKLVEMYIAEAKKTDAAKTQQYWLDKARKVDPENKEVGESLVRVYTVQAEAMDDVEERIRLLDQTRAIRPTAHAYCLLGLAYGEMGDHLKKIEMLQKALDLDHNHKKSKSALGETYFTLGLQTDIPNEKIKWYDMAVMYDPENVKALHNYGMVLRSKGIIDEAIEKFEQAINVDPNFSQSYLNLGVLYWKKKNDLERAIKNFRYYTLIDPDSSTSKKVIRYIKHLENELKLKKMIHTDE